MPVRIPITLITGPLGSGKTTLLRHILDEVPERLAILMNEFGELGIDAKVIEGKNIRMKELDGGCVCCSLLGEFEVAVQEIIETVNPDRIVVEATGLAEPDALVFDIEESLPQVWLDGVISVMDADALVRFPRLGHTARLQVEAADVLLVNKIDLVDESRLDELEARLRRLNPLAVLLRSERCRVDPDLLLGLSRARPVRPARHVHQPEFESLSFVSGSVLDRESFERLVATLGESVYRAKGFVLFACGSFLFNYVAGRWDFEPFAADRTELVFIGRRVRAEKERLVRALEGCRR